MLSRALRGALLVNVGRTNGLKVGGAVKNLTGFEAVTLDRAKPPGPIGFAWYVTGASVLAIALLQWRTVWLLYDAWQTRTFSHGFFVLPISLFLLWQQRRQLAKVPVRPNLYGCLTALLCAVLWVLGAAGDVRLVQEIAFVGLLISTVWAALGSAIVKRIRFPLAFLIFMVPFGTELLSPLQDFTANFAVAGLHLTGIPALLDGRLITLPTGDWQVAEACAGIHYLISMLVLGTLFAAVMYRSWKRRVLLLVASFIVPILVNGIRGYCILLLAYESGNRLAVGVDHIIYGWVLFCAMAFGLFSIAGKWREEDPIAVVSPDRFSPAAPATWRVAGMAVICVGIVALTLVPPALWARRPVHPTAPFAPVASDGWTMGDPEASIGLSVKNPISDFAATYHRDADPNVSVVINGYWLTTRGVPIASSSNPLIEGGDATAWRGGTTIVQLNGKNQIVNVNSVLIGPTRWLALSWYSVGGVAMHKAYRVKLGEARARLFAGSENAQRIVVTTRISHTPEEAEALLATFIASAQFPVKRP